MGTSAENIKQTAHQLIEQLPDNATWEDMIKKMQYCRAVEVGQRAAEQGEYASQEEVRETFKRWGANIES